MSWEDEVCFLERDGSMDERIQRIKTEDDGARTAAWLAVRDLGSAAVSDLAEVMSDENWEIARAAKNGLWRIVRHSGRLGAEAEKRMVIERLITLLDKSYPLEVRSEAAWMLSEIGGDESVAPIASLLTDKELREDARMALERLPGEKATLALQQALKSAPQNFRLNLAHSLRVRGVKVTGYTTQKLKPQKLTGVKAVGV